MNALIQNGVNINLVDGDEQTALHIAAANGKMFFFQQDFQAYFFLIFQYLCVLIQVMRRLSVYCLGTVRK